MLFSYIVYIILVILHASGLSNLTLFGLNWASDGFCLSYKGTLYTSHLLCFYLDSAFTILLYLASRSITADSNPNVLIVKDYIGFTFMHGVGHLFIWIFGQDLDLNQDYWTVLEFHIAIFFLLLAYFFYFAVLVFINPFWLSVIQSIIHSVVTIVICPIKYHFAYVTAVITMNSLISALLFFKHKDYYYDLSVIVIGVPVTLITWLEPILCDSFLVNWGGHVWFDISLPASMLIFLFIVSYNAPLVGTIKKSN